MARQKKEGHNVSLYMDKSIAEKLDEFCFRSKFSKTAVIEKSVVAFITEYYKKNPDIIENEG